jgi:hypothetical protein
LAGIAPWRTARANIWPRTTLAPLTAYLDQHSDA